MTRGGIRPFAALAAAVLAAAALGACGGSGSSTTASVNSNGTATTPPPSEPGSNGSGASTSTPKSDAKPESGGSGGSSRGAETAPLKVSGGGSAQYRVKGGDNSVQEFGEESGESELEEASAALHGFYVARAEEDWPAACAQLSKAVVRQLGQLASRSDNLSGKGCPTILSALTPSLPAKVQKELTAVDAGSLRTEGERAFLIYRGMEGTVYTISMAQEGGAWKVGALAATPLS